MIYKKFNKTQLIIALSTSIALFLFYLFFNLNYLSLWIDEMGDCLTYDYYVRLGLPQFLYNPHHIAFDRVGELFYIFLKERGYKGSSMVILQLRNLIVSSIGTALFFIFMFKISKKYLLSLVFSLLISFTAAYWMYSQINDTPIIHSVMVFILCFIVINFHYVKIKSLYAVFIGIAHGINIFFHQYDALFFVPIFFVIVFGNNYIPSENIEKMDFISNKSLRLQRKNFLDFSNFKYFLLYFIAFTVIVASAYYYVGMVKLNLTLNKKEASQFNKIKNANYFFNWLILYTTIDHWGKGLEKKNNLPENVAKGVTTYFFQPKNFTKKLDLDFSKFTSSEKILINFILIMFIAILIFLTVLLPSLFRKYGYVIIGVMIFMAIYTIFSFWWEPYYREFYVATMFAYWLFLFLGLNCLIDKFKIKIKIPVYIYLFLFMFLLFFHNFTIFIYPNASREFRKFDLISK